MLSKEQLLDIFEYRDGELYWKIATTNRHKSDRMTNFIDKQRECAGWRSCVCE